MGLGLLLVASVWCGFWGKRDCKKNKKKFYFWKTLGKMGAMNGVLRPVFIAVME